MNDNLVDGTTVNRHTAAAATPPTAHRRALLVVSVLLAAAIIAAVVGAVLWVIAERSAPGVSSASDGSAVGTPASPTERGSFLQDAEQAALNLTTVTPEDTDSMLANIESSSTGDLALDLKDPELRAQLANDVKDRGVTQISEIAAISASKLDMEAGQGRALVFVVQNVTSAEGQSALRRQGVSLEMELVDGVWKVSTMEQLYEGIGAAPGGGAVSEGTQTPGGPPDGEEAPEPEPEPSAENPAGS